MKKLFIAVALLCGLSALKVSAQAKFSMSAPKSVAVNQNFQLNVTLENANGTNLRPPACPDFQVLSGPNTSTSIQLMNGAMSQSVTYSFILKPKHEGTCKIGKAGIQVSGVNMESNELTIEVTKAVAQPQAQQRQRNPFEDPFFQQDDDQQQQSPADLAKGLKEDAFVRIALSKNSVYNGEMLSATYKLYLNRSRIGGASLKNMDKAPAFEGFWSQEVQLDSKKPPSIEVINGKQYEVYDILKYNLYPQRAGNLKLPPLEMSIIAQVSVRSKSRSWMDDFFNAGRAQNVQLDLMSDGAIAAVKDLPAGKPADFTGAVGKFNLESSISTKEGKTDDPFTYSFKLSGTGNLKLVDAPKLQLPSSFEVYDPKIKENITNGAAGLTGSKQYDYLIIPRQPGDYKIDKYSFTYFDPSTGKYNTITTPEYSLKVTGTPSKNLNTGNGFASKQDVALLGQDIRYIKTNTPVFDKKREPFFASAGYYGVYAAPMLLFIGLIALKRRNENLAADIAGSKRRRALKLARKRLSIADKYLRANEKKPFYDEVSKAMWGYLGDKLSIDMAELSKDNVEEKLSAKSVKGETITTLINLISTCEVALYTPVGENGEMKKNYDTALNLIADIEDEVKK